MTQSIFSSEIYKKKKFNNHLFVLLTVFTISFYATPEIYSTAFLLIMFLYVCIYGARIDRYIFNILQPLIFMMLLGFIFCLDNKSEDILRDIWYGLKAIICLLLGYLIGKHIKNPNKFINLLIKISFLVCIIAAADTFTKGIDISIHNASQLHNVPILFAIFIPLALFKHPGFSFAGSNIFRYSIIFVIFSSFLLSLSRTAIGSTFVAIIIGAGLFESKKKIAATLTIITMALVALIPLLPSYDSSDITFFGKISNSLSELSFIDDSDMSAAINNWRGFEAFRAFTQFTNASTLSQIFGRGWGATVDLGFPIQMGESMEFQYLPILHNGYMHTLTKYGLIGTSLYFLFLWRTIFQTHTYFKSKNNITYAYLASSIGLIIAYSSLTITGIFNKLLLDPLLIFLGFLFGSVQFNTSWKQY